MSKRLVSCATEQLHSTESWVAFSTLSIANIMDGLQTVHQDQGQRSKLLQDGINHGGNTRKVYASGPAASAIFLFSQVAISRGMRRAALLVSTAGDDVA